VLLDIGGEVGALVVIMPAELKGVEVEIHRIEAALGRAHRCHDHDHLHFHDHDHELDHDHGLAYRHEHCPHVAVVARPTPAGDVHSLVFPELLAGAYELYRRPRGPVELTVTISGGAVTEAAWPA
jgi:hypothetical protein